MATLTLVHLSDLHFHALPGGLKEWTSKRLLGALNWTLKRRRQYPSERYRRLLEAVRSRPWDHLLISGDLTQLALEDEFRQARDALAPLLEGSAPVSIIPGNHDRYVSEACEPDRFQAHFGPWHTSEPSPLPGAREVLWRELGPGWRLLGWDSTHPNDWLSASGTVFRETLEASEALLGSLAPETQVVLMNHYPLWFPEGWRVHARHELLNLESVREWVWSQPRIRVYLHGHVHRNWHLHLQRPGGTPLDVVNSASSTMIPRSGTESSFHQIELLDSGGVRVEPCFLT